MRSWRPCFVGLMIVVISRRKGQASTTSPTSLERAGRNPKTTSHWPYPSHRTAAWVTSSWCPSTAFPTWMWKRRCPGVERRPPDQKKTKYASSKSIAMTHTSTPLMKDERADWSDTTLELYSTATTIEAIVRPMSHEMNRSIR